MENQYIIIKEKCINLINTDSLYLDKIFQTFMIIYHNPRCGKSRNALQFLKNKGIDPVIRFYLVDPLSVEEIKKLISKTHCKINDLIRKKESIFISEFQHKNLSDEEWVDVLAANPVLLQRPIIEDESKAAIVRSDGALEAFFATG